MSEVVHVHVGSAGIGVGAAFWELFCLEHGIQSDGKLEGKTCGSPQCFEDAKGHYRPRQLFVDLEPRMIDEIRCGKSRELFDPNSFVTGKGGGGTIYARGCSSSGKATRKDVKEKLRKIVEKCSSLQGLVLTHSIAGGTGSGLGKLILELLQDYGSATKMSISLMESSNVSSPVQYYNQLLGLNSLSDLAEVSIMMDNVALNRLRSAPNLRGIKGRGMQIQNNLVAKVHADSFRILCKDQAQIKDGTLDMSALVPMMSQKFLTPSYCWGSDINQNILNCLDKKNFMLDFLDTDITKSKLTGFLAIGSGPDAKKQFAPSTKAVTPKLKFVSSDVAEGPGMELTPKFETKPKAIQLPLLPSHTNSTTTLQNHTAFGNVLQSLSKKHHVMYSNRAYLHWFIGEGMEESAFQEAYEAITTLKGEYDSMNAEPADDDEEEDD